MALEIGDQVTSSYQEACDRATMGFLPAEDWFEHDEECENFNPRGIKHVQCECRVWSDSTPDVTRAMRAYDRCPECYSIAVWTNEDGSVTEGRCPTCGWEDESK